MSPEYIIRSIRSCSHWHQQISKHVKRIRFHVKDAPHPDKIFELSKQKKVELKAGDRRTCQLRQIRQPQGQSPQNRNSFSLVKTKHLAESIMHYSATSRNTPNHATTLPPIEIIEISVSTSIREKLEIQLDACTSPTAFLFHPKRVIPSVEFVLARNCNVLKRWEKLLASNWERIAKGNPTVEQSKRLMSEATQRAVVHEWDAISLDYWR